MNGLTATALRSLQIIRGTPLARRRLIPSRQFLVSKRAIAFRSSDLAGTSRQPSRISTLSLSPSPVSSRSLMTSVSRSAGGSGSWNDTALQLSMTTEEYERVSERDMDTLHENLEILCEDFGQGDWEVEYSSGVMNLTIPSHGTYVINKQPPNQQIWISSPVSGPSRFDYVGSEEEGRWVHHRRPEIKLGELLDSEMREILSSEGVDGKEWAGTGLR